MSRAGSVLRIANCSGFYGDRLSAPREMVEGGPIDVLTGDYLAELTLAILYRDRQKDPGLGYARTFLLQLRQIAEPCLERGIKIVVNAGGLNPKACAEACRGVYGQLGLRARVAHIEGDDLLPRLAELQRDGEPFEHLDRGAELSRLEVPILSANAYLGGWGIAEALGRGADLVICPRVTDASLVVGPAAWFHGWARDDWDRLSGAVAAGHILECGAQATGGNYSYFERFDHGKPLGFPIAEVEADGSFTITKHPGTGGEVSVGTVTAQLLYEIDAPRYANPDVIADFASLDLRQDGRDRVRVTGARGGPPPSRTKVCLNYAGGFKNRVTFLLGGLDIDAKARWAEASLWQSLGGRESFDDTHCVLDRADGSRSGWQDGLSRLTVSVKDRDPKKVGRRFSSAAVELALASYPGFNLTAPPGREQPFAIYWPASVARSRVSQELWLDGERVWTEPEAFHESSAEQATAPSTDSAEGSTFDGGPTERVPLGRICGARSGDKGGNANVGIWVESDEAYGWLRSFLTPERLRSLLPEADGLKIDRYELPNLRALNFVLTGLLGDGVAASLAVDAQAKGLGEAIRAVAVEIPTSLLTETQRSVQ